MAPPPPRHVNRWSVAGLAVLAVSLATVFVRHGACRAAAFAAGSGVGDRGPARLWRLEEMGVRHYALPALLTAKEPVLLHVWLKAQRQEGKVLLRRAAAYD